MTAGKKENKTSKSEQTQKKIIDSYLNLIRSKKWDKITVKEICVEAVITRGTFYQYFNDIYDLMENIENHLIECINKQYIKDSGNKTSMFPLEQFENRFDYAPPAHLKSWFKFCKQHKKEMSVLIDPQKGDSYFVKKLKAILSEHINHMMDIDGMPHDTLRLHFTKIFIELHFLAARTWLESEPDEFLSTGEIINLLNTMRVGANYLTYRKMISPEFDLKMDIPDDNSGVNSND